jgi:hypothetical protein
MFGYDSGHMADENFWAAVGSGAIGGALTGVGGWLYKLGRKSLRNKTKRDRLVRDFEMDAVNLMHNAGNWIGIEDGGKENYFPLVNPTTGKPIKRQQDSIIEYVGKAQDRLTEHLAAVAGLFSFSRRQRDLLWQINKKLGTFGATVAYYGGAIGTGSTGVPPLTGESGEKIDLRHVKRAYAEVRDILTEEGNVYCISRRMRYRYRFFPRFLNAEKVKGPYQADYFGKPKDEKAAA